MIIGAIVLFVLNLGLTSACFIGLLGRDGCKQHGYWKIGGSILILSLTLLVFETKGYLLSLAFVEYLIF